MPLGRHGEQTLLAREQNTLSHLNLSNASLQPKRFPRGASLINTPHKKAQMMSRRLATLLCTATALVPPAPHTRRLEPLSYAYRLLGHWAARTASAAEGPGRGGPRVRRRRRRQRGRARALEARCGLPTVPQVYLDDDRVGGADDTLAALADGWLLERDIAGVELKRVEKTEERPSSSSKRRRAGRSTHGDAAPWNRSRATSPRAAPAVGAPELIDAHVTLDGIDYASLKTSRQFQNFVDIAHRLPDIGGASVGDAFWINLYNAMVLHATVVLGSPDDNPEARTAFFSGATGATYEVAGHVLSLDDEPPRLLRRSPAGGARELCGGRARGAGPSRRRSLVVSTTASISR